MGRRLVGKLKSRLRGLAEPAVWRPVLGQFLRFSVVGAAATAVHYAILISLVELGHAPLIPSTSAGFIVGALVSYTLNRKITFSHQPDFGTGLLKYVLAGFVGLGLNAAIVAVLVRLGLPYILAQMVATGVVLCWNFMVARLFVFRSSEAGLNAK